MTLSTQSFNVLAMLISPARISVLLLVMIFSCTSSVRSTNEDDPNWVFEEKEGIVAVEAEHFYLQTNDSLRKWYVINEGSGQVSGDSDGSHIEGASGGQYLEILPDTRVTHADSLLVDVNFSNVPGEMGVVHYKVHFTTPGKYYVWVRAFSTGTEDNGLHVGLDGEWPESGRKLQWCAGKDQWTWESKQRTDEEHCGVPGEIYLMVEEPGEHTVSFSMREDGFEFDKWLMSLSYEKPEGMGTDEVLK